ncbi:MAG: carboxypeptidase-like regulatory domain-containing protein [Thiobacillus sp.]
MNTPDSSTVNTTAKKIRFSSATLALIVGLALLLPGAAALAIGTPIPGIDIVVKKNPGGIAVSAPTGSDGTYQLQGLAAGSYDLSVGGKRVQTLRVGSDGRIKGVLSRQPDGKASITFNGQVGVVPDLPGAAISTARSNIKRPSKVGAASEGIRPILDVDGNSSTDAIVAAPKGGDGKLPGKTVKPLSGIPVGLEGDPGSIKVSAQTDSTGAFHFDKLPAGKYKLTLPGLPSQSLTVGEKGTISGVLSREPNGTASITFNGKVGVVLDLPNGKVKAQVTALQTAIAIAKGEEPVRGEDLPGKTGHAPKLVSPGTGPHRSLKAGDPIPGIPVGLEGDDTRTAPGSKGDDKKPGLAIQGDPIPGTEVGLEGDPEGIKVSAKTDGTGAFHFDKLPAGKYKLKVDGLPDQPLTVGADGIARGKVMKGRDGSMHIFYRWGNSVAKPADDDVRVKGKGAESPVGFGRGNADFGGTGPGMMGGGMTPPGAAMGGPGPSPMGSPGGAMRP